MLNFLITNQKIELARRGTVASDQVDFVRLGFTFSEHWDNLDKTAQFTQGGKTYNVHLGKDLTCTCLLPQEITTGTLAISVFGYGADEVVRGTTEPIYVDIKKSGFIGDGETPIPPTPDLYAQLLGKMQGIVDGKSTVSVTADRDSGEKVATITVDGVASDVYTHTHDNQDVLDATTAAYTTEQQDKLAGIEEGANKYTHPAHDSHDSGLYKVSVDDEGHVDSTTAVTKDDITALGIPAQDTTYTAATASEDGLMAASDKAKLDSIEDAIAADLQNYYTKTETDQMISTIPKFAIEVVAELPTTDISDATVYLVKSGDESENLYTEYIRVGDTWETLGTQSLALTGSETDYGTIAISADGSVSLEKAVGKAGTGSYAEVFNSELNKAIGDYSHAEGSNTTASGPAAHAEGYDTVAYGGRSHAEGASTTASAYYSHAEGARTTASGSCSHAEGARTTASGERSHSEGVSTTASGAAAHAEGYGTIAASSYQHAQGRNNVEDSTGKYAFIIGNGESVDARSNALAVDWQGNIYSNNSETSLNEQIAVNTEKFGKYLPLSGGTMATDASIKIPGSNSQSTSLGGSNVTHKASTGSWAMGTRYTSNDETTVLAQIGAKGNVDTLEYLYFGGTYDNPLMKLTPNGTLTTTSFNGNATSATKLQTARTINGVAFDGTADITVPVPDDVSAKIANLEARIAALESI